MPNYLIDVFHASGAHLTESFDSQEEATAAAQVWNHEGYRVDIVAGDFILQTLTPAPANDSRARFDRDLELIRTIDEAIERLISVRVSLDTE